MVVATRLRTLELQSANDSDAASEALGGSREPMAPTSEIVTSSETATTDAAVRSFAIVGSVRAGPLGALAEQLVDVLGRDGFAVSADLREAGLVLNLVDPEHPRPFRRRRAARSSPRCGAARAPTGRRGRLAGDLPDARPCAREHQPLLRAGARRPVHDDGARPLPGPESALADVVERLAPLATARLVIDNEFRADLEPELWRGDADTRAIAEVGRRLDGLGLLPAPFPVEELVSARDLRHIKRLYSIGGLSYGNLSARKDDERFWMSASGVDKAKLDEPGRDILLVSGYDAEPGRWS